MDCTRLLCCLFYRQHLIGGVKKAINVDNLGPELVCINQYSTLAANFEFLETSDCTMTEAYKSLKNMLFHDEPFSIQPYVKKRSSDSDLEAMINFTRLIVASTTHALLQKAHPTSYCQAIVLDAKKY